MIDDAATAALEPSSADIYRNLRDIRCVCGARKTARQSFCRVHYFALPYGLRSALYDIGGYPETFRRALTVLKLSLKPNNQTKDTTR